MWCARNRSEVVKEIKAEDSVRTWAAVLCYRTSVEKHRGWNNTYPLTLAFKAPSKSTNTFPALFPECSTHQTKLLSLLKV